MKKYLPISTKLSSLGNINFNLISALLFVLFIFSSLGHYLDSTSASIHVSIDFSSPVGTSQFSTGMTYVDNSVDYPWGTNNLSAVNRVKGLISNAITFQNTYITSWGLDDPWPDPTQKEPGSWSGLDSRLKQILDTNGTPVITLNEAPWWMKGQLQSDGTTRVLTASDEWTPLAYDSRILDNKMDAWLHLVQRIAERYMVAPYNVRYFQVWNELKGYYDPQKNIYDYTTSAGNANGPNAMHGYTYMYNLVYNRLMSVAKSLRIAPESIKVGGPYVVMDTWRGTQSNPSNITRAYGTYDQRSLDVIQYWLQHKAGAGFIAVDGYNSNKDNINLTDPFTASEKFADITRWIRSLNDTLYPGSTTLPIWWSEWYASPYIDKTNMAYNNAIKTYAMVKLLEAGGAGAFTWGGVGDGNSASGLWTSTTADGEPLPWYVSYQELKNHFATGTTIYKVTSSNLHSIEVLASSSTILLINKMPRMLKINVNNTITSLAPYQVEVINYNLLLLISSLYLIPGILMLCCILCSVYTVISSRKYVKPTK